MAANKRMTDTSDFGIATLGGKYLGVTCTSNGRTTTNTKNRIAAIREAYYAQKQFWPRKDVNRKSENTVRNGLQHWP